MNEFQEIKAHMDGIVGILGQLEGVPLTPNNSRIALGISNSADIVIRLAGELNKKIERLEAKLAGDLYAETAQVAVEEKEADPE